MMDYPVIDFFEDTVSADFQRTDMQDVRANSIIKQPANPVDVIEAAYPRIMKQMELMWGTQEMQDTFVRWVLVDQEGRNGWPQPVYEALLELANKHAILFNLEGSPKWGLKRDKW